MKKKKYLNLFKYLNNTKVNFSQAFPTRQRLDLFFCVVSLTNFIHENGVNVMLWVGTSPFNISSDIRLKRMEHKCHRIQR